MENPTWHDVMGKVAFGASFEDWLGDRVSVDSDTHNRIVAGAIAEEAGFSRLTEGAWERLEVEVKSSHQRKKNLSFAIDAYTILWEALSEEERLAALKLPLSQTAIGRLRLEVLEKKSAKKMGDLALSLANGAYNNLCSEQQNAKKYLESLGG